jgi:putative nucleotidyltransferase with HDIG domain
MISRTALMEAVQRIPPLSGSAKDLMCILADPDHDLANVVRIVNMDPALTMQVLKVANSAALSRREPVDSVPVAISYLGEKMIAGIALTSCAGDLFSNNLDGYLATRGGYWRHSCCVAIAARELAGLCAVPASPSMAYSAGLVHDIGKVVLSLFLGHERDDICRLVHGSDVGDFLATERALLGVDHANVGALLCAHWRLPPSFVQAVRHHHAPSQAPDEWQSVCYVVHLADHVAMLLGNDTGVDGLRYSLDEHYREHIAIKHVELEKILLRVQSEWEQMEQAFQELVDGTSERESLS